MRVAVVVAATASLLCAGAPARRKSRSARGRSARRSRHRQRRRRRAGDAAGIAPKCRCDADLGGRRRAAGLQDQRRRARSSKSCCRAAAAHPARPIWSCRCRATARLSINTVSADQTIKDVRGAQRLQAVSGPIQTRAVERGSRGQDRQRRDLGARPQRQAARCVPRP